MGSGNHCCGECGDARKKLHVCNGCGVLLCHECAEWWGDDGALCSECAEYEQELSECELSDVSMGAE